MNAICRACASDAVGNRLDLGPQPVCNRFLRERGEEQYTHPLVLGQCGRCGLVQSLTPPPAAEVRPRYGWISYREPEGHLDAMVEALSGLPGIHKGSVICGLSRLDDSTLRRFRERGFERTWRFDPAADLGITEPHAGMETIQERLTEAAVGRIAGAHPTPDVVIARYALEHAHDVAGFMAALRRLAPAGYLVFEVPDCERTFRYHDYSAIWEEHTLYFTPETLGGTCGSFGLAATTVCYPYPFQHALVAVAQAASPAPSPRPAATELEAQTRLFKSFVEALPERKARLRAHLAGVKSREGRIALLGAGHAACAFVNILELGDLLEFVVDDNPDKIGHFLPGSRLAVRPSAALLEERIRLCLTAVGEDVEERMLEVHRAFVQAGGRFASIFPLSRRALDARGKER